MKFLSFFVFLFVTFQYHSQNSKDSENLTKLSEFLNKHIINYKLSVECADEGKVGHPYSDTSPCKSYKYSSISTDTLTIANIKFSELFLSTNKEGIVVNIDCTKYYSTAENELENEFRLALLYFKKHFSKNPKFKTKSNTPLSSWKSAIWETPKFTFSIEKFKILAKFQGNQISFLSLRLIEK